MVYGDKIKLGRHWLMCGDARKAEDVKELLGGARVDMVCSDPPYGNFSVQKKDGRIGSGSQEYGRRMIGNESTEAARENFFICRELTDNLIIFGGNYFTDFLPPSPGWVIWNKGTAATCFGDAEMAWTSKGRTVKLIKFLWNGMRRQGSYTLNPKPRVHPTQKPVELLIEIMNTYGSYGDVVLDCFGGSGSTLIACENSFRTCYLMERDEKFCEVIRERFFLSESAVA